MGKNIITFIEFLISIVFICYSILQHLNLSVWFFVIAELLYFCVTVAEILFFEKKNTVCRFICTNSFIFVRNVFYNKK